MLSCCWFVSHCLTIVLKRCLKIAWKYFKHCFLKTVRLKSLFTSTEVVCLFKFACLCYFPINEYVTHSLLCECRLLCTYLNLNEYIFIIYHVRKKCYKCQIQTFILEGAFYIPGRGQSAVPERHCSFRAINT